MSLQTIKINNLTKHYNDLLVLNNLNLELSLNAVNCITGPSGVGKTTLLNIICGLIPYDSGSIEGLKDSKFSYIFQDDRLLPWKTVLENVTFVLQSIYTEEESKKIATETLKKVGLTDFLDYKIHELSGGMKRRVSIARAFAYPFDVLIMDEPFKGLDQALKTRLMDDFNALWQQNKHTVLFVTHDTKEINYVCQNMAGVLVTLK